MTLLLGVQRLDSLISLLERLYSDEHLGQEVRIPDRRRTRRVVDPLEAVECGRLWILVDDPLFRFRVEAYKPAAVHHATPDLAVLVRCRRIEIGVRKERGRWPEQPRANALSLVDLVHELDQRTTPTAKPRV